MAVHITTFRVSCAGSQRKLASTMPTISAADFRSTACRSHSAGIPIRLMSADSRWGRVLRVCALCFGMTRRAASLRFVNCKIGSILARWNALSDRRRFVPPGMCL